MSLDLDIASVADDPARRELDDRLEGLWPEFMRHDPVSALYYTDCKDAFPEHALVAVDRATGEPVAHGFSVPFSFDGDLADGLPETGWDWAILRAAHDRLRGGTPTIVSALEIAIRPDLRGGGISARMLAAMRENVTRLGFTDLVAPTGA
ncbi:hypothetical protein [Catenuloplanes atrovinosus]|uniref:GNAT superfamily N-acetyltransferase n=1 Tax=Catenuloplanes atrovinosus TaxID=137266 RepID=A0AAE3YIQ5_9ACTN|nr:hypothetical protein [Catenuloplanes atrovinosus]MDR7274583.1 GNAT superfamily N-acetyltransferase [Catenuloplanes atrovinosus]